MDFDIGKLWLAGVGLLVGALSGAWIGAQWAATAARRAAETAAGGEEALIRTVGTMGGPAIAGALKGAGIGAAAGLVLVAIYFYFTNPDRGMVIRKVDTGDDRY